MMIMSITPKLLSEFSEIIAYQNCLKYDYHFKRIISNIDDKAHQVTWIRILYPIDLDMNITKEIRIDDNFICKTLTTYILDNHNKKNKFTISFMRSNGTFATIHEIGGIRSEQDGFKFY